MRKVMLRSHPLQSPTHRAKDYDEPSPKNKGQPLRGKQRCDKARPVLKKTEWADWKRHRGRDPEVRKSGQVRGDLCINWGDPPSVHPEISWLHEPIPASIQTLICNDRPQSSSWGFYTGADWPRGQRQGSGASGLKKELPQELSKNISHSRLLGQRQTPSLISHCL